MSARERYVEQLARQLMAAAVRARTAGSERERSDWQDVVRAITRTIEDLERDPA
jgi:hypothetical protein